MATVKQLPARVDAECVAGDPFTATLTATSGVTTFSSPACTMTMGGGDSYTTDPGVPTASANGASLSTAWSAADTAALNTTTKPKVYKWSTKAIADGGSSFQWYGGTITVHPVGTAGVSTTTTTTASVVVGGATVNATVIAGTGAANAITVLDEGGYYDGDTAEEIFAELPLHFAPSINAAAAPYNVVAGTTDDQAPGINAAIAALPGGVGAVILPAGTIRTSTSIRYTGDGQVIRGWGKGATSIDYRGSGNAIESADTSTVIRRWGLEHLTVDIRSASGSSAAALSVENMRQGLATAVRLDAGGSGGSNVALKLVGGTTKTTYYNMFRDVDLASTVSCLDVGSQCNGNQFHGGVWEGAGSAFRILPTTATTDTLQFLGVNIATTGSTLGTVGSTAEASDISWIGCRVEPGSATTITFTSGKAKRNAIFGGSWTNITFTVTKSDGNVIFIPSAGIFQIDRQGASLARTLDLRDGGITFGDDSACNFYRSASSTIKSDASLQAVGSVTVAAGATEGILLAGRTISATGSSSNVSLNVDAKGTGTINLGYLVAAGGTRVEPLAGKVGFYGTTPITKPTVSGSRGSNAALASLITALANLGLLTDSSS